MRAEKTPLRSTPRADKERYGGGEIPRSRSRLIFSREGSSDRGTTHQSHHPVASGSGLPVPKNKPYPPPSGERDRFLGGNDGGLSLSEQPSGGSRETRTTARQFDIEINLSRRLSASVLDKDALARRTGAGPYRWFLPLRLARSGYRWPCGVARATGRVFVQPRPPPHPR
jgi:hypothetical protein